MKFLNFASIVVVASSVAGIAAANPANPANAANARDQATTAFTHMLAAIAHPDYKAFVAPTTDQFRAHVDAAKFPEQAKGIDQKIPLAEPYTVKFVTTQRVGTALGYVFEVTLHDGNQILASVTMQGDKVASFHLL